MVQIDNLATPLNLFVSCQGLKDKDILSKSDPQVAIYEATSATSQNWRMIGKTEKILNNLDPKFAIAVSVTFNFEEMKYLKFKVADIDDNSENFDSGDFLGEAICPLHQIVGAPGQQVTLDLKIKATNAGKLTVRSEERLEKSEKTFFRSTIQTKDLKYDTCCCSSVTPRLEISRILENNDLQVVYRSTVGTGPSCTWRHVGESLQNLCNGDLLRPLLFEVFHSESSGKELIGECELSLQTIVSNSPNSFKLKNPKDRTKDVGSLIFNDQFIEEIPTFLDFIAGGCEVNMITAVDFTGSNGDPAKPGSLHYQFTNGRLNEYEAALTAVGDIVLHFDNDKLVPMFGFGARTKLSPGKVLHSFPLNGNWGNPEVYGLDGLFTTYKNSFNDVVDSLSGPTFFNDILRRTISICREQAEGMEQCQKYSILLILTDGAIHDTEATIASVVEASNLPLSVIIVGVGQADFGTMETLDADNGVLRDMAGHRAARDIVQFVPFRECHQNIEALRKKVLAEVPKQLTSYFKMRGMLPRPKMHQ